jgi:hypothetical protein
MIKAFDFRPMPSRDDVYLIGRVIAKGRAIREDGTDAGFAAYTVEVTGSDDWSNREIGEKVFVPFESTFDFDGRVVLV